jgi:decaprenylphospho-beta-D-erythro-pentofuranosid-2-ulose 2-reductase
MSAPAGTPRTVVVLGGASDIGGAILAALVARGTRGVVLAGRHPEQLEAAAAPLRAAGATVETTAFDAEQVDTHEAAVAQAFERARAISGGATSGGATSGGATSGGVDLVLIAFGLIDEVSVLDETPATAGHVAIVTFAGAVSSGLAAAQQLAAQGHGTLVVLSSLAGQRSRPSILPYGAAKAGLDAFTDGLEEALAGSGVRVVSVRPGWVRTRMTAGRRSAPFATSPERVASDVLRGLDAGARVVWSPRVVGLLAPIIRWMPRGVFRIVARSR